MGSPLEGPRTARPAWHLLGLGMAAGALSGLFGVGGGVLVVPGLVLLLGMEQRRANATSLVSIVPIAITGAAGYAWAGEVNVLIGLLLAATGIFGSLLGARWLSRIPLTWLTALMVILLLATAARLLAPVFLSGLGQQSSSVNAALLTGIAVACALGVVGFLAGGLAGLLGIGGGIIMVPAMVVLAGLTADVARGTSLFVVIITAIVGSASHLRAGRAEAHTGVMIGVGGIPGALIGVAVAQQLPQQLALTLFAGLLIVSAMQLWRRQRATGPEQSPT